MEYELITEIEYAEVQPDGTVKTKLIVLEPQTVDIDLDEVCDG